MLGAEMLRRLTAPLRAAAPDDQLAEVTTEIAELARDMARLEAERSSLIVAKLGGVAEAEARVTAIDVEATAIRRRLADLRQAEGRLRSEIAASAQLELDEAATAGRRRLAELHQLIYDEGRGLDEATAEQARRIRVIRGLIDEMATISDSEQIRRWAGTWAPKSATRCRRTTSSTRPSRPAPRTTTCRWRRAGPGSGRIGPLSSFLGWCWTTRPRCSPPARRPRPAASAATTGRSWSRWRMACAP